MAFDPGAAVAAGIVGAVVMTAVRLVLRMFLPLRMDVTRIWGTLLGARGGAERVVGVAVHLVVSVAVAIAYALAFDAVDANDPAWAWGVAAALVHWTVAGVLLAVLPVAHPSVPGQRERPGAFATRFGMPDVVGLLVGHVAYGVVVALCYRSFS